MNRKGFEMSFSWMFALLVGGAVLALALFGVGSFINSERYVLDTETAQQIEGLLNPLQTGLESGSRPGKITFPVETQLITRCTVDEKFGSHKIRIASKSGFGDSYQESGAENTVRNHFIFSDRVIEGKEVSVLVKPFNFPYKVGDMIMLWSDDYCFVDPLQSVRDDLEGLNVTGARIVNNLVECSSEETQVCFGSGGSSLGCDVTVSGSASSGSVLKDGRRIFYDGDLLYGAIFADVDMYECSVKRLMARAGSLAEIYADKSELIATQGSASCGSALGPLLNNYATALQVEESRELGRVRVLAETIEDIQAPLICSLWEGGGL
jgi:hypothetical protein